MTRNTRIETLGQKFDTRLERLDLRHGADMKHVLWMVRSLILLNLAILGKLMPQQAPTNVPLDKKAAAPEEAAACICTWWSWL
ncbi:hypothetical protein O0880_27275 [Janthinobacterium sp. SUN118]|uniref:hypothetical protein n=1 Tax=Janthinobacterium sp. SUN118 TaxID=3004100 RepID=UPI0025B18829|nr:hypothetical protein [Janthinobacterium sp. SUN118]MDN2713128.1 hypothetical protein [Janthinobacterium sp. SUN118]